MKSSEKVVPLRRPPARPGGNETAFLPAALEVIETPASPVGRAIAATIIAVFCLALAWAAFGEIDIVASARGKIIPSGRSKIIQPFETGVVRAIHVHDGQRVKAGDVLIEVDSTVNKAETERVEGELLAAQLNVARLTAALANPEDPLAVFKAPPGADPALVATQKSLLMSQVAEQRAKLAALDRERAQKEAERDTIAATITKIKAEIPILQQQVDVRKALLQKQLTSKLQYLDAYLRVVEQQHEVTVQLSHSRELDAAIAALTQTRQKTAAEFRRQVLSEKAEAEAKALDAAQAVVKAKRRTLLQTLRAPIDGTVQQLAVHTIGGVVTPAQHLLVLVPTADHLRIEATVTNRDIGFVHVGQPVEIKVDAFDFTRYGLLHGRVLSLSHDAIVQDQPAEGAGDRTLIPDTNTGSQQDQKLSYSALISLDRPEMRIGDKLVNLTPGMAVTAEIKTGSRTILSYLLSPLWKLQSESLRGR
ncbi:MAG TPA: HlyD family type I secretion periplasmic adaptor subunit [Pseudolabrys sp.]|nr:HlyD family type I secretion periplasmic adaptor subunit [Pseudolabrys sp.]